MFSPLQLEMIGPDIWNKKYHLTLTALLYYCVKCEQVNFVKTRIVALTFS